MFVKGTDVRVKPTGLGPKHPIFGRKWRKLSMYMVHVWGKDKVTVVLESYRFDGIKLPFLFEKVTVSGPKLPFFEG